MSNDYIEKQFDKWWKEYGGEWLDITVKKIAKDAFEFAYNEGVSDGKGY